MTLTGGQTGNATLSVTIPATEGAFSLQVRAADSDGVSPSHTTATGSGTVVVDGTAPSVPSGLRATAAQRSIDLSWSASSDAVAGVAGYTVLRNGVVHAQTTALTYSDTRVSSGVSYTYSVVAKDRAGNASAASPAVGVTATTKSGGPKR
jgi:cellulose 1,4-beta-cellobiosidase